MRLIPAAAALIASLSAPEPRFFSKDVDFWGRAPRRTRPADVPGQSIGQADYVLIAEIVEVDRFEQQAGEHVQRLEDNLSHLVSSRGMLVLRPAL